MKQILFAITLFLSTYLSAYASYPTNLEGTYDCSATEIDTNELSKGVATLTKTGETYLLKSKFTDGSTYVGVGIYDQKRHILAVGSINPKDKKETGVTIAYVEKNGNVSSTWTYLNKTNVGHGICSKRASA